MAKGKLSASAQRTKALDLAREVETGGQGKRSTEKLSVSLTTEERNAIQQRSAELMAAGHRDLKLSRLCRVAFRLLLDATEEQVLAAAEQVENLELRRVKS